MNVIESHSKHAGHDVTFFEKALIFLIIILLICATVVTVVTFHIVQEKRRYELEHTWQSVKAPYEEREIMFEQWSEMSTRERNLALER